jgi:hypothetical protein
MFTMYGAKVLLYIKAEKLLWQTQAGEIHILQTKKANISQKKLSKSQKGYKIWKLTELKRDKLNKKGTRTILQNTI